MFTVLLTRPQQDSNALADRLAEHGIASIISPVIMIKPHTVTLPDAPIDAILLTSRHALHAVAGLTMPCYAVGAQTALAAQQCGLHVAAQAETAEALLPLLPANKTYFYPSGAHISHDFEPFTITRAVAYSAEAATMLSAPALHAIRNRTLDGVVLFSARSARIFSELLTQHGLQEQAGNLNVYCLSGAVAQHCNALKWKHIYISSAPTQQAMVELLAQADIKK